MVDRLKMEVHKKTIYSRANCCEAWNSQDPLSWKHTVKKAVEDCRGPLQGMLLIRPKSIKILTSSRITMLASHMGVLTL